MLNMTKKYLNLTKDLLMSNRMLQECITDVPSLNVLEIQEETLVMYKEMFENELEEERKIIDRWRG